MHKNTQISSLLVLPFDNFTGSDTLDYLFNGIHDAVIGDIGKISALRVPTYRTANAYRNVEKSIPEIASELNIDAAVEISVSCYGEDMCFRVKLVSAFPEEKQLWSDDFYMERDQLSNLPKRIARKISEEIGITLTPGEEKRLAESIPIDPAAYEAYLIGMSHWELGKKSDLDIKFEKYNTRSCFISEMQIADCRAPGLMILIVRRWGGLSTRSNAKNSTSRSSKKTQSMVTKLSRQQSGG